MPNNKFKNDKAQDLRFLRIYPYNTFSTSAGWRYR